LAKYKDEKLIAFLKKYEKERFAAAGKELGKSVRGVQRRVKELNLVSVK
jgi:DNA-binding Lrp family transcriptional regulator